MSKIVNLILKLFLLNVFLLGEINQSVYGSCNQNNNCKKTSTSSEQNDNNVEIILGNLTHIIVKYRQNFFTLERPKLSNITLKESRLAAPRLNCEIKRTPEELSRVTPRNWQSRKWYNGDMWMQFDPAWSKSEVAFIYSALKVLDGFHCNRIGVWASDVPSPGDHVYIQKGLPGSGCWSYIGKIGGRQEMNLEPGCLKSSIIVHEAMHALGFEHEQSRPDRDNYVNIFWENITPGLEYAFRKIPDMPTFNVPYDYRSLMHYSKDGFSKNGKITMSAKNGSPIGPTDGLTELDKQKIKGMYPTCIRG